MKKLFVLLFFITLAFVKTIVAQNNVPDSGDVVIFNITPDGSVVLDIVSTNNEVSQQQDVNASSGQVQLTEQVSMEDQCQTVCFMDSVRQDAATPAESSNAILEQNAPVQFSMNTVICYCIPHHAINAWIKIFSSQGTELKSILITDRGAGEITFPGGSFSAGIYNYSLIVDDSVVDTRQMVLTK